MYQLMRIYKIGFRIFARSSTAKYYFSCFVCGNIHRIHFIYNPESQIALSPCLGLRPRITVTIAIQNINLIDVTHHNALANILNFEAGIYDPAIEICTFQSQNLI